MEVFCTLTKGAIELMSKRKPKRTPKRTSIERGIARLKWRNGTERYLVQVARHGTRKSELCDSYAAALKVKQEWLTRGLPLKDAPPPSSKHEVVATVDDALRTRIFDLEHRGKDAGVAQRIKSFLRQYWPAGASMPVHL